MTIARARAVTAALSVALALAACTPAPGPGDLSDAQLARLRGCEVKGSTHPYSQTSPSGKYRGAYQFDRATWRSVAEASWPPATGMDPAAAPPHVQDHMARALYRQRGARPWPRCGRLL